MEYETIDRENPIEANLDFIIEHFSDPLFPRKIMTKALGYQKEVFNKHELLAYFKASDYKDCRINAYPSYTEYKCINLTAPSFIMIDLDLKDFEYSTDNLDRVLKRPYASYATYLTALIQQSSGLVMVITFISLCTGLF
jgi:hypothetical protein